MTRIDNMASRLESRIAECEEKRNQLISDERADEANFEKIKANIYDIFKTVLCVAKNNCDEDFSAVKDFFLKRLEQIPANWHASYEKALAHDDVEKLRIESVKLEVIEDIKAEFTKISEELQ